MINTAPRRLPTLARRIRLMMQIRDMTITRVAECCGESVDVIGEYINGRSQPSVAKIYRLAVAFRVQASWLTGIGGAA